MTDSEYFSLLRVLSLFFLSIPVGSGLIYLGNGFAWAHKLGTWVLLFIVYNFVWYNIYPLTHINIKYMFIWCDVFLLMMIPFKTLIFYWSRTRHVCGSFQICITSHSFHNILYSKLVFIACLKLYVFYGEQKSIMHSFQHSFFPSQLTYMDTTLKLFWLDSFLVFVKELVI